MLEVLQVCKREKRCPDCPLKECITVVYVEIFSGDADDAVAKHDASLGTEDVAHYELAGKAAAKATAAIFAGRCTVHPAPDEGTFYNPSI